VVGEETGQGGSLLRASLCASRLCGKKTFAQEKGKCIFTRSHKGKKVHKGVTIGTAPLVGALAEHL